MPEPHEGQAIDVAAHDAHATTASNTHYLLLILGGLLVGTGVVGLYYSFGNPATDLNGDMRITGFDGLDNISALPAADWSIALVAAGLFLMAFLNGRAWRYTGGY